MNRSLLSRLAILLSLALVAAFLTVPNSAAATVRAHVGPVTHNPLLKQILGEEDEANEDDPSLSAQCQNFIGQPNPYGPIAPNVDQITGDSIVTAGSQTGCSSAQNETSIAVNPNNPNNLVAGANDYRVYNSREDRNDGSGWAYTTFDGGQTWANIQLPHLTFQTGATGALSYMDSAGDPVLGFGPGNTVYYGNIAFSRAAPTDGGSQQASAIVLNVSHDGGLHWAEPVIIQLDGVTADGTPVPTNIFNDKIWLAANKHNGTVYVTWTRFAYNADGDYLESPIVVSVSTDFGAHFGNRKRVDVPRQNPAGARGLVPYSQGSNPQVSNDGTLYVAYEGTECKTLACNKAGDRDVTVVARADNGAHNFTRTIVDTNYDFPLNEDLGDLALTGENFRINSYPQLAYDPVRDRLGLTWNDDRNGLYDEETGASIRTNGDNIFSASSDGIHWRQTVAVGTPQDEIFGAVAAQDGLFALTSYTRHYNASGIRLDYAYWKSTAGQFTTNIHRVTTQSSNPRVQFVSVDPDGRPVQGVFIGDYTGTALGTDLVLHPCWTDFRGRPGVTAPNQDAYTQAIAIG